MPTFLIHRPDDETQVIKLKKDTVSIGRRDDNDVVIDDVFVSRHHAELLKKGDHYVIKDCQSRYGTFVNGTTIDEAVVNYGDEIQLGNTVITFVDEERLNQVMMRKTPSHRIGAPLDLLEKLNLVKKQIAKGESQEVILRSLNELSTGFSMYNKKLGEAERSKEVASTLCEVGKIINFVFDLNVLLNLLMDLALKILQARRGFIMLHDPTERALRVKVARNMGGDLDPEKPTGISKTIAWQAFKESQAVSTEDATKDERFKTQESVISYAIGSVICVPLISKDRGTIGVIYLDNPVAQKQFSGNDIEFMQSSATFFLTDRG
jgi:pSer/pThr/pTyr-binding forkhead associated (FHA) protein